jgi:serine/threonine protein kinase
VREKDFEYFHKLGEGGFGVVIQCRKKSTQKVYAMKVQKKVELLGSYRDDVKRIDLEVRALAVIRHPFITSMDYSFQNENFVMIVMELASGSCSISLYCEN